MLDGEKDVDTEVCEKLLKSAHDLIDNAQHLAPHYVAESETLQDIRSLINEFSLLKSSASTDYLIDKVDNNNISLSQQNMSSCANVSSAADSQSDDADSADRSEFRHKSYQSWLSHHWLTESQVQLMAERMSLQWKKTPAIAIFVVHEKNKDALLANTIQSLKNQLYKNWTLTVISERSRKECLIDTSAVMHWVQNDNIDSALNDAMIAAKSEWLSLLKCGDRLAIHSLFSVADYDNLHGQQWRLVYSDEDYMDGNNERSTPLFKPDINIDYLRCYPYIGRFCFFRKSLLLSLGGFPGLSTCYNEELVFRAIELHGESVVGHIADVLMHRYGDNDDILELVNEMEWRKMVTDHLCRSDIDAAVTEGYLAKTNRVIYRYAGQPLITVIIPTKNRPDLIEPCVTSLFEITDYKNFELIIVDNGSDSEDVLYYYDQWQKRYGCRIRILSYDKPFNFSAMNNYAVRQANGEYLVLLNNDTEIINGSWMERMLAHARRPDVGVVGARLLFPDGKLQHAGVILGLHGVASHVGAGDDFGEPGYMARYQVDQNFTAVTAACFMTSRHIYEEVGGLDEEVFKVLFNDVNYCLQLKAKGYRSVWTPYATLVHKQSASLNEIKNNNEGRLPEYVSFINHWRDEIRSDPAFNQNLSLHHSDYLPEMNFSPAWNTDFPMRPKIFSLPQDYFGCGNYRVWRPLNALSDASIAEICIGPRQDIYRGLPAIPTITEIIRMDPDVILMQLTMSDIHIIAVEQYKRNSDAFMIADLDDLKTDLPDKNCNKRFVTKDVRARLRKYLSYFDRLTVSTLPLAESYKHLIDEIVVVPNRLDKTLWGGLTSKRRTSGKPRVGWAGAQQHQGDLEIIIDVVKQTANEIDWIFMGMCLDELTPYVKEAHDFEVAFTDYPAKMASLNLDLAVAPLEIHPFNEAKSNLRLLEYGMLGWPVVCTDIFPYQNAPVKRVNNTTSEWLNAIRERIYDLDSTAREGDALRAWVLQHWILQDHIDDWAQYFLPNEVSGTLAEIA